MILFSLSFRFKAYWLDALILLSPVAMIWSGGPWDWTTVGWYWWLKHGGHQLLTLVVGPLRFMLGFNLHRRFRYRCKHPVSACVFQQPSRWTLAWNVLQLPLFPFAFVMDIPRLCIPTNTHMFRIAVENPPRPSQTHPEVSQQFLKTFGAPLFPS